MRRAQYEAAEAEFRRCIQIDSTQSAAYLNLGKVLAIQNRPEAITAFEQAVARNPDAVEARTWLARLYRSQREPTRAAAQFEAASCETTPHAGCAKRIRHLFAGRRNHLV